MSKKTVKSILISQPQPSERSPYFTIAEKYDVQVDFNPLIEVEGVSGKEFRKQRINFHHFPAVIFNSRNAMEHYFRLIELMRSTVSQETKYFCKSEAIALYLQKFIQYRKRKVFFGDGSLDEFKALLTKHKSTGKFLYPCTDDRKDEIPKFLRKNDFEHKEAVLYNTVSTDMSELNPSEYDMIVFFSPKGVQALLENFPKYKQGKAKIAAFGNTTCAEVESAGFKVDVKVPNKKVRSMSMAIELFLQENNN